MGQSEAKTNEQLYPSVELAYPLALASYDVAQKRLDAIHERLQTLIAFAVTINLAIPVIAAPRGLPFRSVWFIAAVLAFFAAIVIGTTARLIGYLKTVSPRVLFERYD